MTIDRDQFTRFELNFADGPPLTAYELSNYLYYLKVIYTYFLSEDVLGHIVGTDDSFSNVPFIRQRGREYLQAANLRSGYPRSTYFTRSLGNRDLRIVLVSHESPTRVVIFGIATALAIAVILGGGHISVGLGGVEADLNPLGESLQMLKDLF